MKVTEHVFERRIREKVNIDTMQFGIYARERHYSNFTVQQIQKKMGVKERSSTLLL